MSDETEFYVNTFTITVLSETPIWDASLADLEYMVNDGDCVLSSMGGEVKSVNADEMSELLFAAGSEPEFFGIGLDPDEPIFLIDS